MEKHFSFDSPTRHHPSKFFNKKFDAVSVRLLPGESYVTETRGEMIVTILGSCVSACIRDPLIKIGGMNHFLLPVMKTDSKAYQSDLMRYGNYAMERLINGIISRGGRKNRLEIKLFGGANVIDSDTKVGTHNVDFVLKYLEDEGLKITSNDLGGDEARRIHYFPDSGRVLRLFVRDRAREELPEILRREQEFITSFRNKPVEGDIELF